MEGLSLQLALGCPKDFFGTGLEKKTPLLPQTFRQTQMSGMYQGQG